MALDWVGFEHELVAALVQSVGSVVAESPGQRLYAAALDRIYRETDGVITLPNLGMNSEQSLAELPAERRPDIRWSPADWDNYSDDWLTDDRGRVWQDALTAEACRGTRQQWEATFNRYLTMLVRVCRQARTTLRTSAVTDKGFLVLLFDDERYESLLKRCLTRSELSRHFPAFDEETVERARVAALPETERVAFYVSRLHSFDGPIGAEEAQATLGGIGPAAFPALIPVLTVDGKAWQAAKLLADIGQADDAVIGALDAALTRLHGADQAWVARALARIGRLDLVLDHVDRLPEATVVTAAAAPYGGFRDQSVFPLPLDYHRIEDFIERYPAYVPALMQELKPGSGYCKISSAEVDEAVRGLTSPHVLIRQHATCVLGDRGLGRGVAQRVLPLLGGLVEHDPDADVRRLAIVSLLWWRRDSRHYADVVRKALTDPASAVRAAASHWLQEQGVSATA